MSNGQGISKRFAQRRSEGRAALIPYVMAGYPDAEQSGDCLKAIAEAGADVIELGIPFSDPLADGPTIQAATYAALRNGMTVERTLEALRSFRAFWDTPVVLFSYLNPILQYGVGRFISDAAGAGAQGLLLTDLPAGEDHALEREVQDGPLDLIRLVAPTTEPARVRRVAEGGQGFLYYISRTGVTGARQQLRQGLGGEIEALREVVALPIAVGFGISTPEQAEMVAGVADGVVVGSALITALGAGGPDAAGALVASFRVAMDGAAT
ncbi:MAG: tryptophan synthase subunit alpha [Gemmatimonadota bacterium]|nr:MAG: tryptophan synthase subunit alpha [Gemmatimonadota bacterium]